MGCDACSLCLLDVMDRLWFHQIILLSSGSISSSLHFLPKTLAKQAQLLFPESLTCPSSSLSLPTPPPEQQQEEEEEGEKITSPLPQHEIPSLPQDREEEEEDKGASQKEEIRPTRLNLISSRARSHSSSPLTKKLHQRQRKLQPIIRGVEVMILHRTTSCRSLRELELEEVKGFMDLGFTFKKENLSPRMMSVVPGLQRLGGFSKSNKHNNNSKPTAETPKTDEVATPQEKDRKLSEEEEEEKEEEEEEKGVIRPYLSEAWLIKRPDSPLLNLRLPRVSAASDMKKHLKFWARTVASVIQQES